APASSGDDASPTAAGPTPRDACQGDPPIQDPLAGLARHRIAGGRYSPLTADRLASYAGWAALFRGHDQQDQQRGPLADLGDHREGAAPLPGARGPNPLETSLGNPATARRRVHL